MRLSGIDSLQRGVTSLVANWQLVLVQLVQSLLVTLLLIAGAVPIVLVVGIGTVRGLMAVDFSGSQPPIEAADALMVRLTESMGQLLVAFLVAAVVWTIALLVMAYFQAGVFGVLVAADRKAAHPSTGTSAFRAFSLAEFRRGADALTWKFFWLINFFMVLASLPLIIFGGGLIAALWAAASENFGTAVGCGCGGFLLAALLTVVCSLWWQISMAAAAAGPSGFWLSVRQGLSVLLRRIGAVLVLVLLAVVVGITMAIVLVPLSIVIEVAVRDSLFAYILSQIVMTIIQSLLSGAVGVAFSGALVSLVRGEISSGELAAE